MKQKMNFAQISRTVLWLGLIVGFGLTAARAQVADGTVIPSVCLNASKAETFTRTLNNATCAGSANSICNGVQGNNFRVNQAIPQGTYKIVFLGNANGTTHETLYGATASNDFGQLRLDWTGFPPQTYLHPHAAGETVLLITDGEAVFGYNNTGNAAVNIPRSVSSGNYFRPGQLVYTSQPSVFQPGVHSDIMRFRVTQGINTEWFLNGTRAISTGTAEQGCATITYQGRLSDGNAAANGQFDLQFQAFDTETGGIVQSELITLDNIQVTNGIFTVPLKFGSTLNNNLKARFLQIGVRPGSAPNTDPFTTLAPRQPITDVLFAVNAVNSAQLGGKSADSFLQNSTTPQTGNFNLNGNGTIGGNLTVNGTINGVPAANYLTTGSNFGQSVTTASGTGSLSINATSYTLVPGLTQTVNVPANSVLVISTDGGIQSTGSAANSFSVVDVAIYVDGAAVSERRIVIANNPLPASVGNWALSIGQTLAAGNHTIEVRVQKANVAGSSPAVVTTDSLLIGRLTVAVIKK